MRLLIFYTEKFAYESNHKSLDSVEDIHRIERFENAVAGFIHVEEKDEKNRSYVETKLAKILKWAARKNNTSRIILHSFNHLSESNASPEFSKSLLENLEVRLEKSGYNAIQTPFGYFLNLEMYAPGEPSARIFKEF